MREQKLPAWVTENLAAVAPELINSTLFRFKVKLQVTEGKDPVTNKNKFKEIEVNLLPDLDLDYEILEQQIQDLPSQYAFWAAVFSEVKMGVAVAERKLKMRYGQVTEQIQQEFADSKVKPTVEVIKRIVEKDTELAKLDMEYQKAQMQAGKLYHMIEAIKIKSDQARTLAGFKRNEQERS